MDRFENLAPVGIGSRELPNAIAESRLSLCRNMSQNRGHGSRLRSTDHAESNLLEVGSKSKTHDEEVHPVSDVVAKCGNGWHVVFV